MNSERAFEDVPRMGRPSTITTDENIEAVERIVMRNRQVSVRRVLIMHQSLNDCVLSLWRKGTVKLAV